MRCWKNANALPLLACVVTLTFAAACGDACLDLAQQVCNCLPDDGTRTVCNSRASDSESVFPVTSQDRAFCQKQLDAHACDCRKLATEEGKVGCGIAFSLTAPASGVAR